MTQKNPLTIDERMRDDDMLSHTQRIALSLSLSAQLHIEQLVLLDLLDMYIVNQTLRNTRELHTHTHTHTHTQTHRKRISQDKSHLDGKSSSTIPSSRCVRVYV